MVILYNGRIYRPDADSEPEPPYERKSVDGVEHVTLGKEHYWRIGRQHFHTGYYTERQAREAAAQA